MITHMMNNRYFSFFRYETKSDTVIGDDVLRLHPDESFNLHFPYKRGDFNLHDGVGGSLTGVLADLELIWTVALQTLLGLTKQDLSSMKAVVVIPALYKRPYVKHYMTLILTQIGFGQAFLLQDHVAATFGAGLGIFSTKNVVFQMLAKRVLKSHSLRS